MTWQGWAVAGLTVFAWAVGFVFGRFGRSTEKAIERARRDGYWQAAEEHRAVIAQIQGQLRETAREKREVSIALGALQMDMARTSPLRRPPLAQTAFKIGTDVKTGRPVALNDDGTVSDAEDLQTIAALKRALNEAAGGP